MKIDRGKSRIMPHRKSISMSVPPLSEDISPALAHALDAMDAYVSKRFATLAATAGTPSSPVALLLQTCGIGVETRRRDAVKRLARLTPREADVLGGLADGKNNKTIAFDMNISPKTVEIHRSRIMKKLQCDSLFELGRIWEAALSVGDTGLPASSARQMMI